MKFLIAGIFLVGILSGCTQELETQNQDLQNEVDSLRNELSNKENTLNAFDESFNQIQQNLALIAEREQAIRMNRSELNENNRERITRDIQAINTLLEENKETINSLNKSISNYKGEIGGFKKLLSSLNEDIATKEGQIDRLKNDLTAANFTIEMLSVKLDSTELRSRIQSQMLDLQTNQINTAHYVVGSFKELSDLGIVEKKGSIAGIAGTKILKDDFNTDPFVRINIPDFDMLDINAKKIEFATVHPPESFEIKGDEDKRLIILDPEKFWSASKYLVVIVN